MISEKYFPFNFENFVYNVDDYDNVLTEKIVFYFKCLLVYNKVYNFLKCRF